ncbi:MAG: hypothetical protein PHN74_00885 [Candidatus Pacebacteria bacterium]|nr:hypothetical protein [Candidatus Paceibacterota bacterium]
MWFLFAGLAIIGLVYLLVYSPIFQIKNFKITGNERTPNELVITILKSFSLSNKLNSVLSDNNIIVWPSGEIKINQTIISRAIISKNWFSRTISIKVEERQKFAIWCLSGGDCYWIDKEGVVFDKAPLTEGGLILAVQDLKNNSITLGEKALEERFINNLLAALKNSQSLGFSINGFEYDKELQEIKMTTYGGPYILFSVRFDPSSNINALIKLLKESQKNSKYFDLRIENKIFIGN